MTEPGPQSYAFGSYRLLPARRAVLRNGTPVVLTPKGFDTLLFLVEHRDRVVSKDELLRAVWSDVVVEEANLTQQVFLLRKALEDEEQTYIATIPRVGYRFVAQVTTSSDSPLSRQGPARRRWIIAAAAVGMLAFALFISGRMRGATPATRAVMPRIESLVVLPLENLSREPEQQYFVDGMHEAIIGELSRMGGPYVISRTSAKHYEGIERSVLDVARELNVDAVVEGSVLRAGDRVRIALRLIDGRTDRLLWSNSYDGDVHDVLTLQADVALAVARGIGVALTPPGQTQIDAATRARSTHRADPAAYDAYLKGRYEFARWGEEGLRAAVRYYEESIAKDGAFAPAHAALAHALFTPAVRDLPRAAAAARTAVALDAGLPEAWVALGRLRMIEWDHRGSEAAFKRAISLDPNSSLAHQHYAQLLRQMTKLDDALAEAQLAAKLDPFSLTARTMVAWVLLSMRRYEEAITVCDAVLALDPDFGLAMFTQALAYAMQGKAEEAIAARERALVARQRVPESSGRWFIGAAYALSGRPDRARENVRQLEATAGDPTHIAILHAVLREDDKALDWLEKAYNLRWPALPTVMMDPWFDRVRDHERFRSLRAKIGLP